MSVYLETTVATTAHLADQQWIKRNHEDYEQEIEGL